METNLDIPDPKEVQAVISMINNKLLTLEDCYFCYCPACREAIKIKKTEKEEN